MKIITVTYQAPDGAREYAYFVAGSRDVAVSGSDPNMSRFTIDTTDGERVAHDLAALFMDGVSAMATVVTASTREAVLS